MTTTMLLLLALARPGTVELSDGTTIRGRIHFTEGAILKLNVGRKTHRIDPDRLCALELVVASESMERPYTFKNPGDPTKTYEEGHYPLRNLLCRVTLRDGRELRGELISTLVYVTPEGADEARRFKVVRQQKGEVGQTLDDLVYLRAIRWDAAPQEFRAGTIRGAVEVPDPLEDVVAYHHESQGVYRGRVLGGGRFEITGLAPGTYDLFLQTANEFLHPLAPLPESAAGEDLRAGHAAEVQAATEQASDFFEERSVCGLAGSRSAARALVLKYRVGRTSYEQELGGDKLWRLELWLWHRLEREWRLDGRRFLFRGRKGEADVARVPRHDAALLHVSVEAGRTTTVGTEQ